MIRDQLSLEDIELNKIRKCVTLRFLRAFSVTVNLEDQNLVCGSPRFFFCLSTIFSFRASLRR